MKPRAKIFHFHNYHFDLKTKKIEFNYGIEFFDRKSLEFSETIILPRAPKKYDKELLKKVLESLHIILGISYYKLYLPPKIKIPFLLSQEQADFWNIVYRKGLGELLYRNKLNPKILAKFPHSKIKTSSTSIYTTDRILLGIGGGKDSIVATELLRDFDVTSFLVETQKDDVVSENVIKEIGNPSLKINRLLDQKIFEHYAESYNGHIPISAIFAFLGLLSATLYDYKYVAVGNEQSSNFGNINHDGEIINHQWSKSAEFEAMLQEYTRKFITPDIIYFSLLRQFYEIRIAKIFARHKKYFPVFASCNRNFKVFKKRQESLWCGECPKCLFTFLMLSPFLTRKELFGIFHKSLFTDKKLIPLFDDLLGFGKLKPFDCVGTFDESRVAFFLASKYFKNDIVIKTLLPKIKNSEILVKQVFKTTPAPTLPTPFRFLGIDNICILGYGKEGKITEKYLRKFYPKIKIGICDQNLSKDYLEKQEKYDLAVKTPGIPKSKVTIPYVTATNIFFSEIKKNKNLTIGITGSKGKSTTASLIYQMIRTSGRKARLVGNIGNPMLEVLLTKVSANETFVIELSSYMLDDIEYSPNIAVLLNLFPEHMNYHGGIKNYYEAKKNIFKFQKTENLSVQPPFTERIPLKKSDIPLLGAHNLKNIQAAIRVAQLLKVSDSEISKAIKNFKPLAHRLEFVGIFRGIKFYDDAISTTPESTIMAIKTLKNIGTIFLGGEDRGYDFRELEKTLKSCHIKNIVLFPESGNRILKSHKNFNILETRSMKDAVAFAFKNSTSGQICLLSTASPSYSVWKNFEEKGDLFQSLIKKYK